MNPEIARTSPALMAYSITEGKFQFPQHIKVIHNALLKVFSGEIKRLIISAPPRHGKSELISKYFPAWYIGQRPHHNVILATYEANFAGSWGKKVRDILSEYGKLLFNIELSSDTKSKSVFMTNKGGGMNAIGAGGAITGKGANIFIIDDPIKNSAEANSQTYRNNLEEWYNTTALTRLEPDGAMIIIMTRWHEDDLVGRLIQKSDFHYIRIPAIADENDYLKREVGTALWSKRYPIKELLNIKSEMGEFAFETMYQQNPSSPTGSIFKRKNFKYFSEENNTFVLYKDSNKFVTDIKLKFATMDLAVSTKTTADYTVIMTFFLTNDNELLVYDIYRERIEGAEHMKLLNSIYNKYNLDFIAIESVSYQMSLVQNAIKSGLVVKPVRPDSDKITRSYPASALMEAENIYFNADMEKLFVFESEMLQFPTAAHDDMVDCLSYGVQFYNDLNNKPKLNIRSW